MISTSGPLSRLASILRCLACRRDCSAASAPPAGQRSAEQVRCRTFPPESSVRELRESSDSGSNAIAPLPAAPLLGTSKVSVTYRQGCCWSVLTGAFPLEACDEGETANALFNPRCGVTRERCSGCPALIWVLGLHTWRGAECCGPSCGFYYGTTQNPVPAASVEMQHGCMAGVEAACSATAYWLYVNTCAL